ncbi:MAG: hypothetical protein GEU26_01085 [Nitrososphaeraceae archaeon]|nr:hypothetical protein [Nitrososphaeraceae archaeon]
MTQRGTRSLLYKKALEDRCHSVALTGNGEDCLRLYVDSLKPKRARGRKSQIYSSPFDVVVLDYMMHKKNDHNNSSVSTVGGL